MNYNGGFYIIANGSPGWVSDVGKKYFLEVTGNDPQKMLSTAPVYNWGDISSVMGRLGWTNGSLLTPQDFKAYVLAKAPTLQPENYTQTVAPNNPNATIVTGTLSGQIGPTPPSTADVLKAAAAANGITLTDAQLATAVQYSNSMGGLATSIAAGSTTNPLLISNYNTATTISLAAPTGFTGAISATYPGPSINLNSNAISWSPVVGASFYSIAFAKVGNLSGNSQITLTPTFNFQNLVQDGKYAFTVRACNQNGCGAISAYQYFQYPAPVVTPPTTTPSTSTTTQTLNNSATTSTSTNSSVFNTNTSTATNYVCSNPSLYSATCPPNVSATGTIDIYIRDKNHLPQRNVFITVVENNLSIQMIPQSMKRLYLKTDLNGKITINSTYFTPDSSGQVYIKIYIDSFEVGPAIPVTFNSKIGNVAKYYDGILEDQLTATIIAAGTLASIPTCISICTALIADAGATIISNVSLAISNPSIYVQNTVLLTLTPALQATINSNQAIIDIAETLNTLTDSRINTSGKTIQMGESWAQGILIERLTETSVKVVLTVYKDPTGVIRIIMTGDNSADASEWIQKFIKTLAGV
jgi:hypothetical protein